MVFVLQLGDYDINHECGIKLIFCEVVKYEYLPKFV